MPGIQTPKDLLERLQIATGFSLAELAEHLGLRRQFVYTLRDDKPEPPRNEKRDPVPTPDKDPRYIRIDALCKAHGITGLLDAVDAVRRKQQDPKFDDLREAFRAWREFGRVLSHEGADDTVLCDPEVSRLYMELGIRLRALQNS